MNDVTSLFSGLLSANQSSHEQRLVSSLLFNEDSNIELGDQRLNSIAALTYNAGQCDNIFSILEKSLVPENNPWQTLFKSLLLLHTIVVYGSEKAVDSAIQKCPHVHKLREYNSALIRRSFFSQSSYDYGGPVRKSAEALYDILMDDDGIRNARARAREGQDSLVPIGTFVEAPKATPNLVFGQGAATTGRAMGAGFDLAAIPGMYEGRPERYFDDDNDIRKGESTGDHQFTREAMNPDSLLDLVFDAPAVETQMPSMDYLPALQRQKELEAQLAAQQEQLRKLQEIAAQSQFRGQNGSGGGDFMLPNPPLSPYSPLQHHQQQPQQYQYHQQFLPQQQPYPQQQPMGMGFGSIAHSPMQHQVYGQPQQAGGAVGGYQTQPPGASSVSGQFHPNLSSQYQHY